MALHSPKQFLALGLMPKYKTKIKLIRESSDLKNKLCKIAKLCNPLCNDCFAKM